MTVPSCPIELLQALVVFAGAKNIDDAAEKLGVTQPALSKQLKRLEAYMPLPIFSQLGRKKVLTPYGQSLRLALLPRLSGLADVIEQTALAHSRVEDAHIRIAGRRGLLDRFSADLKFAGSLALSESSNEDTIASVKNGEVEIGIVHFVPDSSELMAKLLVTKKFQIVIPKKLWREFSREQFNEQLQNLPCLSFKSDDEILRSLCEKRRLDAGSLKIKRSTENYASLAQMVESGLGWAVIPTYLPISKVHNWRIAFSSQALSDRNFYLLYRRELAKLNWFRNLIAEIQGCFR